jgi:alanyl-tRNA synthetase
VTTRLYHTDSYLREFEANVVEEVSAAEGDTRPAVLLDRTAFYPTSGGQPFDTGTLGDARVVDVIDRDDGAVLHVVDAAVPPGPVRARIDWDRRFEHMQQHTGQHILSAAFEHTAGVRTASFHLGSGASTVDLAREVSGAEITRAELAANQVVWEDRAVSVRFVDEREAAALALRKEPVRTGTLRLVDIERFDLSACGGTHVSRTGAVGNISIASAERFRGGTRLEFSCGIRTLRADRVLRETVSAAARLLSTAAPELPAAVERLLADGRDSRRRMKELQDQLAAHEAERLAAAASPIAGASVAIAALESWDAAGLKAIASGIIRRPGHAAILAGGAPVAVVVARAGDLTLDAAAIVKQLVARFGGKGGGRPELAQAGGLAAKASDVADFARGVIEKGSG